MQLASDAAHTLQLETYCTSVIYTDRYTYTETYYKKGNHRAIDIMMLRWNVCSCYVLHCFGGDGLSLTFRWKSYLFCLTCQLNHWRFRTASNSVWSNQSSFRVLRYLPVFASGRVADIGLASNNAPPEDNYSMVGRGDVIIAIPWPLSPQGPTSGGSWCCLPLAYDSKG